MRILVKDITVGRYVKVHRTCAAKPGIESSEFKSKLNIGIICGIPEHRRFCTVQFFNQMTGKPIYRESFFWSSITLIDRPEGFKCRLPAR